MNINSETNSASVQMLLAEFGHLHEMYTRQRNKRNERATFFIGVATGIVGVLVLVQQTGAVDARAVTFLALAALILLSVFGFQTHQNLVKNDINSDKYLRGMRQIKKYFVDHDAQLAEYFVFSVDDKPSPLLTVRPYSIRATIQLLTSFFIASAVAMLELSLNPLPTWYDIVPIFILTIGLVGSITIIMLNRAVSIAFTRAKEDYESIKGLSETMNAA